MPRSSSLPRRRRASPRASGTALPDGAGVAGSSDRVPEILQATHSVLWEGSLSPLVCERLKPASGNPLAERLSGVLGEPWIKAVDALDQGRVQKFFGAITRGGKTASIEYRLRPTSSHDKVTWVRHLVLRRNSAVASLGADCLLSDISDLKQLQAEHLRVSEREKNRIGQDLHDDLCQVLAGLSCLTRVLENRLAPKLPEEVSNLREINRQMVDAMDRTRALTHGLVPAKMQAGDPRPTLLELANQVELRFGVKVRLSFHGTIPSHELPELLQLYRIAQEAISNAIRHGRANSIKLDLRRLRSSMQLTVRDNGIGFPAAKSPHEGIGLQIMRHRASLLGGGVHVGNAPRRGVLLKLQYQPSVLT